MKGMVLQEPRPAEQGPLKLSDMPIASPGSSQVRIRVQACGVCHTDLHTAEGELDLPKLPVVPGHQIVGTVDALGTATARVSPGGSGGSHVASYDLIYGVRTL